MKDKPCILVIDDEKDIIDILSFILKKNGMDIVTAADGIEALKLLNSQNFSGVVSDLLMPNMDGLELLRIVRANKNTVPFLFLSGHATSIDEHDMINLGAYELITKPQMEKIPEALRKLFKANHEIESLMNTSLEAQDFIDILHDSSTKKTG